MTRSNVPPRFVPTLTEVVQPPVPEPAAASRLIVQLPDSANIQEQLVHRVMQRVDITLERLLRETVDRLVTAHTETLAPNLRDEIEIVVCQCVNQAFEEELASQWLEKH